MARVSAVASPEEQALAYRREVMAKMAAVRASCDALEDLVSKEAWPYPSYGNLLYRV